MKTISLIAAMFLTVALATVGWRRIEKINMIKLFLSVTFATAFMGLVPTRRGALMLRRLMIVFVIAVGAAVFASSAAAESPRRTEFSGVTFSSVLTDVCSFPVAVDSTVSGTEIDYFDNSGALTRIFIHQVEQDTFTANGHTLVGLPFTVNVQFLFDSGGNVTNIIFNGVFETIPLPDGSLFVSAGRADLADHPGVQFIISPDEGNPGDVAGFCAALSP
jgi:hypothetical protein